MIYVFPIGFACNDYTPTALPFVWWGRGPDLNGQSPLYTLLPEVANILGVFFSNAFKTLNVKVPSEFKVNELADSDDPIDNILSVFSKHPSIFLINENVAKYNFRFHTFISVGVEKEIKALDIKKASMSSSIPSKVLKQNSDICSKPLTEIINHGLFNSCFDTRSRRR